VNGYDKSFSNASLTVEDNGVGVGILQNAINLAQRIGSANKSCFAANRVACYVRILGNWHWFTKKVCCANVSPNTLMIESFDFLV